jgi:hypothetical protein
VKNRFAVVLGLLALASGLRAGFLDLGYGSRPQGMGNAFTAVVDDSNAITWNPAGLALGSGDQIQLMHGLLSDVSGVSYDLISWSHSSGDTGLGFAWDGIGASLDQGENDAQVTNTLGEHTYLLSVGTRMPLVWLKDQLSVGLSVKRFSLDSPVDSSSGWGLDAGALYLPARWMQIGAVLHNLAAEVGDENFPATFRLGAASYVWQDRLILALDLDTKNDVNGSSGMSIRYHLGTEVDYWKSFPLRLGYDDGGPCAGFGARYSAFGLDYAFLSNPILGTVHRISVSANFNSSQVFGSKPKAVTAESKAPESHPTPAPTFQAAPAPKPFVTPAKTPVAKSEAQGATRTFGLSKLQSNPEPFKAGGSNLHFTLAKPANVTIRIYQGLKYFRIIRAGLKPAGASQVYFNGLDDAGKQLPPGKYGYIVYAQMGGITESRYSNFTRAPDFKKPGE